MNRELSKLYKYCGWKKYGKQKQTGISNEMQWICILKRRIHIDRWRHCFHEIGYTRLIDDIDIRVDDIATVLVQSATKCRRINCRTSNVKRVFKYGNNGIKMVSDAMEKRKFRCKFDMRRKTSSIWKANILANSIYIFRTVMESSVKLMWPGIELRHGTIVAIKSDGRVLMCEPWEAGVEFQK